MKLLDELAFKQKRLRFAAHDVEIEIMNRIHQRLELEVPAHPPGRLEILANALAQVAGLADVDNRAEPVAHQVDAWLVRQGANLLADVFGDLHASHKITARSGAWQGRVLVSRLSAEHDSLR